MLSKVVSNFLQISKLSLVAATAASHCTRLLFQFGLFEEDGFEILDSTTKGMPLVNGAVATSGSLFSKLNSKEKLISFFNKLKFFFLSLLCKPFSVFRKSRCELFTIAAMIFFMVLDLLFVLFCAYAALRTFCPGFADSIGLRDLTAVSNLKEVKGLRQCYLYLKQHLMMVA